VSLTFVMGDLGYWNLTVDRNGLWVCIYHTAVAFAFFYTAHVCFSLDLHRRGVYLSLMVGENDFLFNYFFFVFLGCRRLGCLGTSMAVTEAQNPLLGENTCGSLLKKLQVTTIFIQILILVAEMKMCTVSRIV